MKRSTRKRPEREKQLANLVPGNKPGSIMSEVRDIFSSIPPGFDSTPVATAFDLITALFSGKYPGYRSCNTGYHDLSHTLDVFLAMARLVHGALMEGMVFSHREIQLGLTAALFHDSGYIQEIDDRHGTGAKHTPVHEERSSKFLAMQRQRLRLDDEAIEDCSNMILCTRLSTDISTIAFRNGNVELLGKILGAADVVAQMADRTYLEKLLFLYYEFKESNIGEYDSELDLLRRTPGFFDFVQFRLSKVLDGVDRFMQTHLQKRWGIKDNLYETAIRKQRTFLEEILNLPGTDPREHLKRDGIVDKVRSRYQENEG